MKWSQRLKIDGMYCPFCAEGIERKLNVLKGVEIKVSYPEGIGIINVISEASLESLIQKIEEKGFQATVLNKE